MLKSTKYDDNGLKFTDLNLFLLTSNNCKIELDSNIQICGRLKSCLVRSNSSEIAYLQFEGPTELQLDNQTLPGHTKEYHSQGYGTPVGYLQDFPFKSLAEFSQEDLIKIGIQLNKQVQLIYESGIVVDGILKQWQFYKWNNIEKIKILQFENCTVKKQENTNHNIQEEILFRPEWGMFDLAIGSKVIYASL